MDLHLRGKRVLITGASKGIGAAAAEALRRRRSLLAARTASAQGSGRAPAVAHQIGAPRACPPTCAIARTAGLAEEATIRRAGQQCR